MDEPVGDRIRDWLAEREIRHQEFADRCQIDRALLSRYLNGHRRPSPKHRRAIERETNGEFSYAAWDEPLAGERRSEPPASEERPVAEAQLPPLEGTPAERLRTLETWLEGLARSGAGLSTDLHRAVTTMISSLQAQIRAKPLPALHEHPDWARAIEVVLDGVEGLPGGPQAVLEAVRRARASSPEQAEAA